MSKDEEPTQPPEIDRRLELSRTQWIGLAVIAVIPLLAAIGVFGERWATGEAAGLRVRAHVEYPSRFRARLSRPMMVRIENTSGRQLDTVDVVFDSAYVERFSMVEFIPSPQDAYVVSLGPLRAGESRRIHVQLEGDMVGRHRGRVLVRTQADSAAVVVQTTVFP